MIPHPKNLGFGLLAFHSSMSVMGTFANIPRSLFNSPGGLSLAKNRSALLRTTPSSVAYTIITVPARRPSLSLMSGGSWT